MPRKAQPTVDGPPGPLRLEVRINDKIVLLQRVHSYAIDQQVDDLTVTGVLRLPAPVESPALKSEPVKPAPTAEMRFEAAGDVTKEETS